MDAQSRVKYNSFRFTHIPKCGGTSFRSLINESALSSGIPKEQVYIPGFNGLPNDKNISQLNPEELENLQTQNIKVFAGHTRHNEFENLNVKLSKPFNITVLRDPVKRFISHYNFFNYKLGYNNCQGIHLNNLDQKTRSEIIKRLSNIQCHYLADIKNFRSIGPSNLLKLAKYNLEKEYHIVGILERIDICIEKIKNKSPDWITFDQSLPSYNKGEEVQDIEQHIIQEIEHLNDIDLEIYKFGKEIALANN